MASLALIAIADAQAAGTWRRLKTCRNPRCEAAFYDRSRNNSGTWHDVWVCGNPANLRAYRARRHTGGPGCIAGVASGPDADLPAFGGTTPRTATFIWTAFRGPVRFASRGPDF